MTGRYKRKAVPLEVRGISRGGGVDCHPLPESVEDADNLPQSFIDSIREANQHYYDSPLDSGRSSPTTATPHSEDLSLSNVWTTGNNTDRSSLYSTYSWGDDISTDFDRQASRTVRQLFEEIDSMLFEECQSGPQHVYTECNDWTEKFPHIRILGRQIHPPQDLGFEVIVNDSPRPGTGNLLIDVTEQDLSASHDAHRLSITGKHVEVRSLPRENSLHSSEPNHDFCHLEEEIFDQDGYYEDIIAVDYHAEDDIQMNKRRQIWRSSRKGLPPVTPNACVKDNVACFIFDFFWSEVITWIRNLLSVYGQLIFSIPDDEDSRQQHQMVTLPDIGGTTSSFSFSPTGTDTLPPSRETNSTMRGLGLGLDKVPRLLPANPAVDSLRDLDGLLTISSKALQSRERTAISESADQMMGLGTRPGSSVARSNRPFSTSYRMASATIKRNVGRGRLAPLDRAKTPSVDDERPQMLGEVLRGYRLPTATDRLSSPPNMFAKNGPLPPIRLDSSEQTASVKNLGMRKSHFSNRATSAVIPDGTSRLPFRERDREREKERAAALALDVRPSTTHTFRSDTPFGALNRRSSTPMGLNNMRGFNSTFGGAGGGMLLGVTGNSLIHHPEHDTSMTPPVYEEVDDDDDDEEFHNILHVHTQWAPNTAAGKKGKQINFVR